MELNGTTQNNDESNFSENQTFGLGNYQTGTVIPNETQDVNNDGTSSVSSSSSNVNISESESDTGIVSSYNSSSNTDAMLIQSPKLLKNANLTSPSSSTKNTTDNTDNDNSSTISGSFLKNLFEINGPASRSINELKEKYPYLPYYSLFSLLTASIGHESVENMLEWMRCLQAKQVTITEELIKCKECVTEKQISDADKSEDYEKQANARAGISPSGGASKVEKSNKCVKILIIIVILVAVTVASILTAGAAAAVAAIAGAALSTTAVACIGIGTFVAASTVLTLIGASISGIVSDTSKDPLTRAKVKEYCDLLNPVNAAAEIVVMVAEIWITDEATLQKIRLIARIIFTAIYIVLAFFSGFAGPIALRLTVAMSGLVSGILQILQAVGTLSTLEKQKEVAERRFKLETTIAYCEKLQKDLDIISSEIDMLVELFTAAMDKIRAEYNRISRMIKETSDVKNMIARNIGA